MLNTKEDIAKRIDTLNTLIEKGSAQAGKSSMLPLYLAQRDILTIKLNTNRAQRRSQFKHLFVGKK